MDYMELKKVRKEVAKEIFAEIDRNILFERSLNRYVMHMPRYKAIKKHYHI